MKIEFHSLAWPNTNGDIIDSHKSVMNHFGIPINYTIRVIDHGKWMTQVVDDAKSDIICFFDIDCVPINDVGYMDAINYVKKYKTFAGITQVSNHISPATHIYAAPAFFVIHKDCWNGIKVSFEANYSYYDNKLGDVGEMFTYAAEDRDINFKLLYPTYYYKEPEEGIWRLSDKGWYGIGTIFDNAVYHLYQSRSQQNVDLFNRHCRLIINGGLDTSEFKTANKFDINYDNEYNHFII